MARRKKTEGTDEKYCGCPPSDVAAMNELAARVWAGQSESLPRHERVRRIERALAAQGYDVSGLELPES